MSNPNLHSTSPEWQAERAAGDLVALLNRLDESRAVIRKLAYHAVNFDQIFIEAGQQGRAIEDMRAMLFDAIQQINAVIEAKK